MKYMPNLKKTTLTTKIFNRTHMKTFNSHPFFKIYAHCLRDLLTTTIFRPFLPYLHCRLKSQLPLHQELVWLEKLNPGNKLLQLQRDQRKLKSLLWHTNGKRLFFAIVLNSKISTTMIRRLMKNFLQLNIFTIFFQRM